MKTYTLKEDYITFETAKRLQKIGFDVYTETSFTKDGDVCNVESILGSRVKMYPRITQSLLQKWLRNEQSIFLRVDTISKNQHYAWIHKFDIDFVECYDVFETYEKALENGLFEALGLAFDIHVGCKFL